MSRNFRYVALTTTTAVLAGSLSVAVPPSQAAAPAREDVPNHVVDRMSAALLAADDIPGRYKADQASGVLAGTDNREQPDVCPTSREQELDDARAWATTQHSGAKSVAIQSKIWLYGSKSAVRRSPKSALKQAIDCRNRSAEVGGKTLSQRSGRSSGDSAWQVLTITSKRTEPKRTRVVTSWRISGRFLVNVSIQRFGKNADRKYQRADLNAVEDMAATSAERLNDAQAEPPAQDAPVYPGAPSFLPDAPKNAPWVVSLGDSYISGEGGAWAGNVENSLFDSAVYRGAQTYFDNPERTAELIKMCHRSDSAAIHIGVVQSLNLACSGATARSATDKDGNWKPGIDFADQKNGPGRGQAAMLQDFAATHEVRMVSLSIGGNDFEFAGIVEGCVKAFLFSPYIWSTYCSEQKSITDKVSQQRVEEMSNRIAGAIGNVQTAMRNAGYSPNQWKLVVHNYPSPLPRGDKIRYWQTIARQSDGGCGFWNRDADWANDTVLPRVNQAVRQAIQRSGADNVVALDLSKTLNDNRLCEDGTVSVDTLAGLSWKPWTTEKEFRAREWVMQIRAVSSDYSDATQSESFHPNLYGQLAIRNCLRQVYEQQRGGQCVREDRTITDRGEPNMALR